MFKKDLYSMDLVESLSREQCVRILEYQSIRIQTGLNRFAKQ